MGAGMPRLSGSWSDGHSEPPGGAQIPASVRKLRSSRLLSRWGKREGPWAPLATARVRAYGSRGDAR